MSPIGLQGSSRQGLNYGSERDAHVMVSLHINMLVKRILWFEGFETELWEILSSQFQCCQTGD